MADPHSQIPHMQAADDQDLHRNSTKEQRDLRHKYSDDRFQQLNGLLGCAISNTWTYLLTVNGGAAAGILAFIGSSPALAKLEWPYYVLLLFLAGLVLVGFAHAYIVHKIQGLTDNWINNTSKYWHNELDWAAVLKSDQAMVDRWKWVPRLLGWLSLGSFVFGVVWAAVEFRVLAMA